MRVGVADAVAFLDHRQERVVSSRVELPAAAQVHRSKRLLDAFADKPYRPNHFQTSTVLVCEDRGRDDVGQRVPDACVVGVGVDADAVVAGRGVVLRADGQDGAAGFDLDEGDADLAPGAGREAPLDQIGPRQRLPHPIGGLLDVDPLRREQRSCVEERVD
jgi:hypothetical protein